MPLSGSNQLIKYLCTMMLLATLVIKQKKYMMNYIPYIKDKLNTL